MSSNKKGKTCRIIALILSGVLSVAAVAGAGTALYMGAKNNGWFEPEGEVIDEVPDVVEDENAESASDIYINESASNGLTLTAAKLTADEYEEYGISTASVESAYTLTASYNSTASDPTFTWTSSGSGVTLTPSSNTRSCVVTCSSAFGSQITITCTAKDNANAKATCTVDYYRRVTALAFSMYDDYEESALGSIDWSSANSTVTWKVSSSQSTSYDANLKGVYSGTFGTGTLSDSYSYSAVYKSNITGSTYSFYNGENFRGLLSNITGVAYSSSDSTFRTNVKSALTSAYNNGTAAAVFTVTATGANTGITCSFTYNLIINPSNL